MKETSAPPPTTFYGDLANRWMPSRATMQPVVPNDFVFRSYMKGRSLYVDRLARPTVMLDSMTHEDGPNAKAPVVSNSAGDAPEVTNSPNDTTINSSKGESSSHSLP